ncbi:hypothetical protein ATO12_15365 [Aquimarina atlantica]|uniref:Uncharacterized protein n=1 Tax=Aquimarina atlantica TaxID=1317122 RepID=A0A023BX60_9FLAO|nr:DUF6261 family protein [Aquimarina atlantica]EZH74243.1 hypothetical protein ATO12_15365 [Aquimarina atlantica]
MLTSSNLIVLHKEEFIEFLRNTVDICEKNDPVALHIQTKVDPLRKIVARLDDALIYEREKEFTKELEELDRNRDEAVTGLRYGFLMNTYHKNPTVKTAAHLLLDRIDSYGGSIARMNYESESAAIHNLISDLETEHTLKTALQKVELQHWADHLKVTNQKFRELYSNRIEEESKHNKTSFTTIKPEAITVYTQLINRIKAYIELDENNIYDVLQRELTTLAERYQQIITHRKEILQKKQIKQ